MCLRSHKHASISLCLLIPIKQPRRKWVERKATKESEAGIMPPTELLEAMGKFNEELANAGIVLAGEGLHPSAKGKRVAFAGNLARPFFLRASRRCGGHEAITTAVSPELLP